MNITFATKFLVVLATAGSGTYMVERFAQGMNNDNVTVVDGGARLASIVQTPAFVPQAAAAAASGCQSRSTSLPWGTLALRSWTPTNSAPDRGSPANAGIRIGNPFTARLIQAYGVDSEFSKKTAIFEFADGCRRQYQVASFAAADVSYINDQIGRHPFAADTATYALAIADEGQVTQDQIDRGEVVAYQTQHFNLMYGTKTGNFSYTYQVGKGVAWQSFLKAAGKTLEDGWAIDRAVIGAPMPYGSSATKKKINIYICGTGLPFIANGDNEDCGASAAKAGYMSAVYLQPGSTTVWHEFGHSLQFYSGGFRDKAEAGPIWETGANFVSFTASPTFDQSLAYYYSNLENGPLWSMSRYGTYPFMSYLFEKDATRRYVWSTWTNNLRDAGGASTEDFTQTLVRLAKADGVYPNGYQSFADDMGWYGARLAAGDLLNQKTLLDLRNSAFVAKLFAPLQPSGGAGSFSSPTGRPLLQWGTHIVPLTASGASATAALTGATVANSAAWRWMIVSVAADGTPRYSSLGSAVGTAAGAAVSLPVVSGEKMYLVVTATPYAYQSLGWQPAGKPFGNTFPYRVSLSGATPLTGAVSACNSVVSGQQGQDLNYNTNGYTDQPKPCA